MNKEELENILSNKQSEYAIAKKESAQSFLNALKLN